MTRQLTQRTELETIVLKLVESEPLTTLERSIIYVIRLHTYECKCTPAGHGMTDMRDCPQHLNEHYGTDYPISTR